MAYMEWLWFYEFVTVHTTVKKAISNMLPLSVRIGRGKPNLEQNVLAALTVDSTVWFGRGIHSTHLVNWSIVIKINKFFFLLIGIGPIKI